MKANELRIGNIVGCDIQSVTVKAINDETCVCHNGSGKPYVLHLEDLFGMKLTEEWLLKFGFEKDNMLNILYYLKNFGYVCLLENEPSIFRKEGIEIKIKHVHQLQNLYFALTGEELILNEK